MINDIILPLSCRSATRDTFFCHFWRLINMYKTSSFATHAQKEANFYRKKRNGYGSHFHRYFCDECAWESEMSNVMRLRKGFYDVDFTSIGVESRGRYENFNKSERKFIRSISQLRRWLKPLSLSLNYSSKAKNHKNFHTADTRPETIERELREFYHHPLRCFSWPAPHRNGKVTRKKNPSDKKFHCQHPPKSSLSVMRNFFNESSFGNFFLRNPSFIIQVWRRSEIVKWK